MKYRAETMVVPYDPRKPLVTGNVRKIYRVVGPSGVLDEFGPYDYVKDHGARLAKMLEDAYEAGKADGQSKS